MSQPVEAVRGRAATFSSKQFHDAVETVGLLDLLRGEEMWAVSLIHDNPDDGHNNAILCEGEWVDGLPTHEGLYPAKFFWGESILDCLRQAHVELTAWREKQ